MNPKLKDAQIRHDNSKTLADRAARIASTDLRELQKAMLPPSPDDGPADHYVIDVANLLALPPDQWGADVKEIVRQCYGSGWSPRGTAEKVRGHLKIERQSE